MLEWSHDGGQTFSTQRMIKLGQQGRNLTRIRTHRLGQAPKMAGCTGSRGRQRSTGRSMPLLLILKWMRHDEYAARSAATTGLARSERKRQ